MQIKITNNNNKRMEIENFYTINFIQCNVYSKFFGWLKNFKLRTIKFFGSHKETKISPSSQSYQRFWWLASFTRKSRISCCSLIFHKVISVFGGCQNARISRESKNSQFVNSIPSIPKVFASCKKPKVFHNNQNLKLSKIIPSSV